MTKFKIGEKVKFKGKGSQIPKYYTDDYGDIPEEKIVHGTIILHENYLKDFAKVVDIHNEYYIVEYEDSNGKYVRLGFEEDVLDFVESYKFKQGDKVILSIPRDNTHWEYDGKTGMIITDDNNFGNPPNCRMVKIEGENATMISFPLDVIELAE